MAYKQNHKYGYRDSLEKGDPEKVIYGQQFDDEFEAIEQAIADIDPNADGGVDIDEIDGLQDALDNKADKDHTHDEYVTDAPNDGKQYVRESEAWAEVAIPEGGINEPDSDGKPYARQVESGQTDGAWVESATPSDIEQLGDRIDAIEEGAGGGSVQIGEAFDGTPSEGDQWLETPAGGEAVMWVYDGEKWLQMPGGKDGADGADSPWTDNGTSITYGTTTIDASGTHTMLGGRLVAYLSNNDTEVALSFREIDGTEAVRYYTDEDANFSLWDGSLGINRMRLDASGNMFVAGAIYKNGSTPVMTSMDLIETLHTLRQATKDESTVEGLRDSIGNAIGGLIEKFEAMQAEAGNE